MTSIENELIVLGIYKIKPYYKIRNIVNNLIMNDLLDIAFDIWYYILDIQKLQQKDLALFIRDNLTDDEIIQLFWIFKKCRCCNHHYMLLPKTINQLELINMKLIQVHQGLCVCQCNKAVCYLHKAYHYNKYHIWI